uniref:Uncharacterized protein n=1 Tax=Anguilla anguilla TaxID=7936 RepID=A0A0E9VQM9_ANGAN
MYLVVRLQCGKKLAGRVGGRSKSSAEFGLEKKGGERSYKRSLKKEKGDHSTVILPFHWCI